MSQDSRPFVRLSGSVDFRDRSLSLTSASALRPATYPPFDSLLVAGWQYVEIDSSVSRPSRLRPDVNWVSFQGTQQRNLPIPQATLSPAFPFTLFGELETGHVTGPQFLARSADGETRVAFQLQDAQVAAVYTVTIDAGDRIDEIAVTTHFRQGRTAHVAENVLNLTWTANATPISAPPSEEVQSLTAGENLYANNTTTTTVPLAQSDAVAGNQALFTANRAELEASLRATPDPKLTELSFDPHTDTVSASFAYAHPALENLNDYDAFAWQIGQNLSGTFWFPELVQNTQSVLGKGVWLPHLHIQVDKVSYTCAPSVEIAMAATGMSLRDWVAACRG